MKRGLTALSAACDELPRVVRASAADDHDGFNLFEQVLKSPLMLLGRQADRVDELDLGIGIKCGHGRADRRDRSLGSRRLADDSQSRATDRPSLRLADSMTSKCSRSSMMPSTSTCPRLPIKSTKIAFGFEQLRRPDALASPAGRWCQRAPCPRTGAGSARGR